MKITKKSNQKITEDFGYVAAAAPHLDTAINTLMQGALDNFPNTNAIVGFSVQRTVGGFMVDGQAVCLRKG
jgi:hypothetical protein